MPRTTAASATETRRFASILCWGSAESPLAERLHFHRSNPPSPSHSPRLAGVPQPQTRRGAAEPPVVSKPVWPVSATWRREPPTYESSESRPGLKLGLISRAPPSARALSRPCRTGLAQFPQWPRQVAAAPSHPIRCSGLTLVSSRHCPNQAAALSRRSTTAAAASVEAGFKQRR